MDTANPASTSGPTITESSVVQKTLRRGCQQIGLAISDLQAQTFELYYNELVAWNSRFNLTAITDYEDVQIKHFLDSLVGWPIIAEEIGAGDALKRSVHLADVGSGAGFPGIPLKIIAPRLKLTLIDGTGKKIMFLQHVVEKLGLEQTQVVQGRAEELGRQTAYRGQFDIVTARAVAPLASLMEYLLPLVRHEGLAVVYKGAQAADEFVEARRAIELLGGETVRFAPVAVPMLDEKRYILLIRKSRQTPQQYPRGQGLPRKRPLS
jgi:16S rRNA (guanine527-N7)-methyltransferase